MHTRFSYSAGGNFRGLKFGLSLIAAGAHLWVLRGLVKEMEVEGLGLMDYAEGMGSGDSSGWVGWSV